VLLKRHTAYTWITNVFPEILPRCSWRSSSRVASMTPRPVAYSRPKLPCRSSGFPTPCHQCQRGQGRLSPRSLCENCNHTIGLSSVTAGQVALHHATSVRGAEGVHLRAVSVRIAITPSGFYMSLHSRWLTAAIGADAHQLSQIPSVSITSLPKCCQFSERPNMSVGRFDTRSRTCNAGGREALVLAVLIKPPCHDLAAG